MIVPKSKLKYGSDNISQDNNYMAPNISFLLMGLILTNSNAAQKLDETIFNQILQKPAYLTKYFLYALLNLQLMLRFT